MGRYLWVGTHCVDGDVSIAATGFWQTLTVTPRGPGFDLEIDTELPDRGCTDLTIWHAVPAPDGPPDAPLLVTPGASVTLPADARCGPSQQTATPASLRRAGDALTLTLRRAAWCRGLQAELAYRRSTAPSPVDPRLTIRRYLARFGSGDVEAAAALFSERGALLEPFSRTEDGLPTRHQGRAAVRRWLQHALSDRPWVALRALGIEPLSEPGQYAARFEYMDPQLASPLLARNLFVIADGQIFETELQLLSLPNPRSPRGVDSVDAGSARPTVSVDAGG